MSTKVGTLIKEARTNAGFTQQELANRIDGLSANDISKAEHNEKDLTTDQLKAIAKATGVTQKSLLEAAAGKSSSSGKTSSSSGKTSSSSAKTGSSSSSTSMKVTTTEKKLVELYREADSDTKKSVMKLLKGESDTTDASEMVQDLLGNALEMLMKK